MLVDSACIVIKILSCIVTSRSANAQRSTGKSVLQSRRQVTDSTAFGSGHGLTATGITALVGPLHMHGNTQQYTDTL